MSEMALQRDIGAYVSNIIALAPNSAISGDTPDGVEQDGPNFDRQSFTNESEPPLSASLAIPFNVAGGTTVAESWAVNIQLQESPEGTTFVDVTFKDGSTRDDNTVTIQTDAAAFVTDGVLSVDINLGKLKRFVRVQVTPTFTGTTAATKILSIGGVFVTGGSNIIPAA